jgi:hypothetical protein
MDQFLDVKMEEDFEGLLAECDAVIEPETYFMDRRRSRNQKERRKEEEVQEVLQDRKMEVKVEVEQVWGEP